jgi:hypothetical protein
MGSTADIPARVGGGRFRGRWRTVVRPRPFVVVALAGLAILGSACSGSTGAAQPAAPAAPTSTARSALRTTALTLDELRARKAHLGYDVREQPVVDPEQFDLGQLRLACGATVALPFRTAGDHKVYRSSLAVLVEALGRGGERPTAVVDAARADLREGCAPVETRWSGQATTASYEGPVEITAPGASAAWTESWATASGGTRYRYAAVAADGDRLTVLDLVVDIRLEPAQVRSLLEAAVTP